MAVDLSKLIYANSQTPHLDAYNDTARMINANYDTQLRQEAATRANYLAAQEKARTNWRNEQNALRDAYLKQAETEQNNSVNKTNSGYDASARQNYINYMQAQKRLPSQLNALGIRGGASESSAIRLGTNYGTNVANNESARNSALAALRQQYEKALADYDTEYRNNLASYDDTYNNRLASYEDAYNKLISNLAAERQNSLSSAYTTARQNELAWEREQIDKDLERFSGAIEGLYKSKDGYKNLIAQLQASNDPNKEYKIMLATRAMNMLSGGSSGGGGGSSRSYGGYSSGGSGGGDNDNTNSGGVGYSGNTRSAYEARFKSGSSTSSTKKKTSAIAARSRRAGSKAYDNYGRKVFRKSK